MPKGEVGEGVTPRRWGSGNFWTIASKWCILVHFEAVNVNFKTENLYEKNCICLSKDFILGIL